MMNVSVNHYDQCAFVVQIAGLSSPLLRDFRGAEWRVSAPCPWIQEGKRHLS